MNNIKTVLFDLDGTLLPLDMDKFMNIYFHEMGKHFYRVFDPKVLMNNVLESTKVMVKNTELRTNEEVFWEDFSVRLGDDSDHIKENFMDYYKMGFQKVKESTRKSEYMINAVKCLKEQGYEVVVATNPMFPRSAIHDRIRWAGFEPEDFMYITSFEENHYCKPQLAYYREVLEVLNRKPEECMMVGNNAQEDIIAGELGIKTWLITDYLIDNGTTFEADYSGTAKEFNEFVEKKI